MWLLTSWDRQAMPHESHQGAPAFKAAVWLLTVGLFAGFVVFTFLASVVFGRDQMGYTTLCLLLAFVCGASAGSAPLLLRRAVAKRR